MCTPSTSRMDEENGAILDEEPAAKDEPIEEGLAKEESAKYDPAEDGLVEDRQQPLWRCVVKFLVTVTSLLDICIMHNEQILF